MLELLLLTTAVAAGFLGALLGLGGGIIVVPVLTLFYHVNIRYAIAASLISVVATSSGAAASYLKDSLTNLRLAVFLEVGTVSGAVLGFVLASYLQAKALFLLFGLFLLFSGAMMLRKRLEQLSETSHPWAEALKLSGSYPERDGQIINYKVQNVPLGLFAMFCAGILSALLGIGSGIFKVLAMDGAMKIPIKASSATSNFMIGVTAAASAGAYLLRGDVIPQIAAPVALGIIVGSFLGAKAMVRLPALRIRQVFVVVIVIVSLQMIYKGLS
ncbi:MAG: sulfite exporter TauE/SafE family protein [Bdellovibrio sp.]|nr:sulfite exporter TauE/SafE family protein [Bdellovibrio sp.]